MIDDMAQVSMKVGMERLQAEPAAESLCVGKLDSGTVDMGARSRPAVIGMCRFMVVGQAMLACVRLGAIRTP